MSLSSQNKLVNDGRAVNELRKGLGWFAEDVKMAHTASLLDHDENCTGDNFTQVTLKWDEFVEPPATPPPHLITYAVDGDMGHFYVLGKPA